MNKSDNNDAKNEIYTILKMNKANSKNTLSRWLDVIRPKAFSC